MSESRIERINPSGMYQPYRGVYSQVVKALGSVQVHLAGTVPLDADGRVVGKGDLRAQVKEILSNIDRSLSAGGASRSDVVRIEVFTLDVDGYRQEGLPEVVAFFGDALPASTLVGVTRLADPTFLVEIQATAVLDREG